MSLSRPEIAKSLRSIEPIVHRFAGVECDFSLAPYPGGFCTQKYLITTKSRKLLLRELAPAITCERAEFLALSQDWQSRRGHAPRLIRTRHGGFVHNCGSVFYLLSEFLPGICHPVTGFPSASDHTFGAFLGELHVRYGSMPTCATGAIHLRIPEEPLRKLVRLRMLHDEVARDEVVISILDDKIRWLQALEHTDLERLTCLPRQVIHGDYYAENVVFSATGRIIGAIDFDQSCLFYRCYEVLRGIMRMLLYSDEVKRILRLRDYLRGYKKTGSLSGEEVTYMLELYHFILLADVLGLEPRKNRGSDSVSLRDFVVYRWRLLRWIQAYYSVIQSTIYEVFG